MPPKSRTSTAPVSSSSLCPACGKAVDTLRAGQVAILDGAFRYFCDADCKASYVDAASKRPSLEAMTVDPPPVTTHVVSAVRSQELTSGVRDHAAETEAFAPPAEEPPVHFPAVAPAEPAEDTPSTLRSPSVTELPAADSAPDLAPESGRADHGAPKTPESPESPETETPESEADGEGRAQDRARLEETEPAPSSRGLLPLRAHVITGAPILGVFVGVLASVVSLAGEGAGVLRLPLALLAAAIVLVRLGLGARDRSEPSVWVIAAPISVSALVALVSAVLGDAHTDAHASFVGLAAASALTVDLLLERARRDVLDARARTASALAVSAKVVRIEGGARTHDGRSGSADERLVEIDAALVKPGEQVVIEAGETIAVDGVVTTGEAEVAPWLDSPALVKKGEGDAVVAGAVVVAGRLRVNTTFSGNERAWLRLAQAQASRIDVAAPLVAFVRRSVERGAPLAAVLVAGAVYADNGSWLDVAIAACGGGYALAAVAAVAAAALAHARGHVAAQRRGIVYKDAVAFDTAARADIAVVCSRGTILLGEPEIVAVEAIGEKRASSSGEPSSRSEGGGNETDRLLAIAAGAEMSSTHPFAAAILHEARARGIRPDNVRSALGHSGLGVTALAPNGDRVIVGSRSFLLQEKVSVAIADARTSELEAEGRSVLLVAVGGRLVGLLALQDGLRPGARAAVQRMHDARIEPVLLSGEARDTCETIARALDIEHVRPEILPVDRGAEVRALADGGHVVAALGHASTDDGALGAADVSIAMEAAGSAPGEWGVALASDDVRDAALSLTVPRACRDRARTAVVVGGLGQALGALGIAFGVAPPAIVPVLGVLAAVVVVAVVREPS